MNNEFNELLNNNDYLILYKLDGKEWYQFCKTQVEVDNFLVECKSKFRQGFSYIVLKTKDYRYTTV